jgi:transcriptional regulator with XRE-family HTH domain
VVKALLTNMVIYSFQNGRVVLDKGKEEMPLSIKDIRIRKGLSQANVAEALGVSSVVYSRYETGSRQPTAETLIQLADIFGVTVDYLLGRQDIEDSTLSEYELRLLMAARNADERAKQDALNMLLAHATNTDPGHN